MPIGGKGNASPIIWGEKVFVLTAVDTGRVDPSLPKPEDQPKRVFGIKHPNTSYRFEVLCLDRNTGKELWRQTASEHVPHEGTHNHADFASASPTTDGNRLYCWFGSAGMYCYDLDGKKLWERQLGKAYVGASLGEGCSPVVHKGRVVIVRDHDGNRRSKCSTQKPATPCGRRTGMSRMRGRHLASSSIAERLNPTVRNRACFNGLVDVLRGISVQIGR